MFKSLKIIFALSLSILVGQNTVGLIINSDKSFDGYTLFAPNTSKTTFLIDNEGTLVHKWESEYVPGLSAYLLEDGHLLRSAKVEDPSATQTGGFQKIDWEGTVVWEFYYGKQHHDVEPMPNGNVLLVTNNRKTVESAIQAGRDPSFISGDNIRSLSILEISQTGETTGDVVWRWNAWDHLVQDFDNTKDNFGVVAEHPELININYAKDGGQDWLHTNSVAYNEELDQIIVSNRNTNEIWIIDHSTTIEATATHEGGNSGKGGDILYRWGNPIAYNAGTVTDQQLFGQHDARWVEVGLQGQGNIIIFNNGISRPVSPYSTVIELVPPVNTAGEYSLASGKAFEPIAPIWEYVSDTPDNFTSPRYGGSQRLPNGNTLICNADSGEFFEVTSEKEVVWKYINHVVNDSIVPQATSGIDHNQVFRCYKYDAGYPGFSGKELEAGEPLKVFNENNEVKSFKLYDNYPNPFNPTTTIEFLIKARNSVTITIFDMMGNTIKTLANQTMEPGSKSITWDSLDENNNPASSGVYFYSLQIGQQNQTKKMILLR